MFKRFVWLIGVAIVLAVATAGIARALVEGTSPWQSSANPTLSKSVQLPPNTSPASSNIDCVDITVRAYLTTTMKPDCVVTVPFGQVGLNGVIFNGMSESIPVVPAYPLFGLQPIPNNATFISYANAPIVGNYLLFYTSIRDKMSDLPQFVNGHWQYTITGQPDYRLKGLDGKLLPANPNTMAFSPNGSWMVVDLPWQGFVRINLETFEIKPFAPSLQQNGDYSDQRAQVAISNDGLNVVVKPNDFDQLKIYDLTSCGNSALPVDPTSQPCASRDYYAFVRSQIFDMKALYQPRFINATQLEISAVYEYTLGNYKVARYTLTAPGVSPTGMSYLGMGDSFASGEGAYEYVAGTDNGNSKCHLSSRNYAFLLTAHLFPGGNSVACSGAKTKDILNLSGEYLGQNPLGIRRDNLSVTQLSTFISNFSPGYIAQGEFIDTYKPEVITLSIGGNDIGFADILKSCVSPVSTEQSCYPTYEDRLELANKLNGVFDRLVTTYRTVLKPGKRVYVIGYPQIALPSGNCASNVHLDAQELQLAADLVDYLNLIINRAADKAGVRYVDVSHAFDGHRMCETWASNTAVNGFTTGADSGVGPLRFIGTESYHPNALGHTLYENSIRTQTSQLTQSMPAAIPASTPPDVPAAFNGQNLPKSGRNTNTVIVDDELAPNLLTRSQNINITLDNTVAVLKALTLYKIMMHSDPVTLGTATTDAVGNLSTTIQVPSTIPPGFHTLHIYGPNIVGQPLDIVKTVYVAASSTDADGNGVLDTSDPCVFLPASGIDADKDGIDDACDGYVGDPPAPKYTTTHLSNSVTLTGNSITLTRASP